MKRTQVQLPDNLFELAHKVAQEREMSLAELVRRGLEYMVTVSPDPAKPSTSWTLPKPHDLQSRDPFADPSWRANLYLERRVAEPKPAYRARKRR